jgi:quercetin dioxygenase-like cupin family protein
MSQHTSQPQAIGLDTVALPSIMSGFRLLATGKDSNGSLALFETCERRGPGPPLHRHNREVELIVVLEGRVTFQIGSEHFDGTPGTCAVLQRGTEHCYIVRSEDARLLNVLVPAGLEEGLDEMRHVLYGSAAEHETVIGQDGERIVATFARYGVEVTGPAAGQRGGTVDLLVGPEHDALRAPTTAGSA